ncbi:Uncharacterized protein HZ326_4655 [Fusarium oxysporum f. sp. albedinis]|nr:Uncharacterized protein HZ326_4655 [Fusarium oxysporum f. sp. albedinis]
MYERVHTSVRLRLSVGQLHYARDVRLQGAEVTSQTNLGLGIAFESDRHEALFFACYHCLLRHRIPSLFIYETASNRPATRWDRLRKERGNSRNHKGTTASKVSCQFLYKRKRKFPVFALGPLGLSLLGRELSSSLSQPQPHTLGKHKHKHKRFAVLFCTCMPWGLVDIQCFCPDRDHRVLEIRIVGLCKGQVPRSNDSLESRGSYTGRVLRDVSEAN